MKIQAAIIIFTCFFALATANGQTVLSRGSTHFSPGLNLVGFPIDNDTVQDMAALVTHLGGPDEIDDILRYNPESGVFEHCGFDSGGVIGGDGCSSSIVSGEGWLVRALKPFTVQWEVVDACDPFTLRPGINLVALPCAVDDLVSHALLPALGDPLLVSSLQALDTKKGTWLTNSFHGGVPVGAAFPISSGQGYIAHAKGFVQPVMMRGVTLAGAEFGSGSLPGTYAQHYYYPRAESLDYYRSKGLTLIRLPFRWERLQHQLFGPLDTEELQRLDTFVAGIRDRNMRVILDPHNYGRYLDDVIGSAAVPNDAFKDFWTRLADHYQDETMIYAFALMNEPHDMEGHWPEAVQAAIDGIRSVDMNHLILVPGDGWSAAWRWLDHNADLSPHDPANNLAFEAHQFFDADNTGSYSNSYDDDGAYPKIGVDRLAPFLKWLDQNKARGFLGEFGVPDTDPRWNEVMEHFLAFLDSHCMGSTYWAGGPWWGDYPLSVEPVAGAGQDRPQMAVLRDHVSINTCSPALADWSVDLVAEEPIEDSVREFTFRAGDLLATPYDPSFQRPKMRLAYRTHSQSQTNLSKNTVLIELLTNGQLLATGVDQYDSDSSSGPIPAVFHRFEFRPGGVILPGDALLLRLTVNAGDGTNHLSLVRVETEWGDVGGPD